MRSLNVFGMLALTAGLALAPSCITVTKMITQQSDSAIHYRDAYSASDNSSKLYVGETIVGSVDTFLRFVDVTVPNSANIVDAYFRWWITDTGTGREKAICYGIAEADTETFTDRDDFFRPKTAATVDFSFDRWRNLAAGGWRNSPSIKDIVQEIVNQSEWQSGNAMGFYIEDDGSVDSMLQAWAWGSTGCFEGCPELVIIYYVIPSS